MSDAITLNESIDEALVETMEGMAFTDVERLDDGDPGSLGDGALWARIDVINPAAGELVLLMGDDLASEVEEATTGESGAGIDMKLEVLGELLNTLAGSWASLLLSDGTPVALGLPKTGEGDWAGGGEYEIAVYETDDEEQIVLALRR